MPFNPDEFLASKTSEAMPEQQGFNPDAFLAEPVSESQKADQGQREEDAANARSGGIGNQALTGLVAAGKTLVAPYEGDKGDISVHGQHMNVVPEPLVSPERGRQLQEDNPISSGIGTLGGLFIPGGQGSALSKAGNLAEKAVFEPVVEKGILAGMKRGAVKLATENALFVAGDETSKLIRNDPNTSVESAISEVGLAAVLGGAGGAALGAVSPLWKATVGNKAGQIASDIKARLHEHLNNPEPGAALTEELSNYHTNIKDMADEVYGAKGLKAQEVAKLIPEELTPKISQQAQEISSKAEEALKSMYEKQVPERYQKKMLNDLNQFHEVATKPDATSLDIFNASQDLKQTLQGYSKGNFGPFAVPSYHEAYDFLNITKGLAKDIRMGLEDSSVWGKAASRQQSINKAFSEYLPSLKDFEKKFTTELNGERVIDPGKVQTYINQSGKASSEVKKSMLQNFMDASEKYKQVIADTHANLGVDNPMPPSSTHHMEASLRDLTPGAKIADSFIKHSASKMGGAILGGIAGTLSHIPYGGHIGVYLGEKFLGGVMPGIAKAILEKLPSGEGLEAARIYGEKIVKGAKLVDNAVKNTLRAGEVLPDSKYPDAKSRESLQKSLDKLRKDPGSLSKVAGDMGHYMPDHAVALGSVSQNVVSFLNSIKPSTAPNAPLDSPIKQSRAVEAQYDRALDIAHQPLIVLDSLKKGTMTSHDVIALQHMYPSLYESLKQKVMNEVISKKSDEEPIPYKTRMGVSMFLAQPMDSTMSPMGISAAQPPPDQPQQQQASQQGGNRPTQLKDKNAKLAQTPLQASEAMHSTGKA